MILSAPTSPGMLMESEDLESNGVPGVEWVREKKRMKRVAVRRARGKGPMLLPALHAHLRPTLLRGGGQGASAAGMTQRALAQELGPLQVLLLAHLATLGRSVHVLSLGSAGGGQWAE